MDIVTKEQAINLKLVKYFTGIPCKSGHIDFRYTNTNICYECKRLQNIRCNSRNKETLSKISKKSYQKNRQKRLANSKNWANKNREKSNQIKRNYKLRNLEKVREAGRSYQKEKRKDPYYKISKCISKALWEFLKGNKNGTHWENLLSFKLQDLINHLQSKFRDGMTWDNYGSFWHVDHIKPLCKCKTIDEAWRLDNLQPLLVFENLSKNKYETWKTKT